VREPRSRRRRLLTRWGRKSAAPDLADRDRGGVEAHRPRATGAARPIETGTYAMAVAMTAGRDARERTRGILNRASMCCTGRVEYNETMRPAGSRARQRAQADRGSTAPFPASDDLAGAAHGADDGAKAPRASPRPFRKPLMHVQEIAPAGARIHLAGETATSRASTSSKARP